LIRKIFVTGDLGVVDLELLLACVYVDPTTNKPFDSIGRFVEFASSTLRRELAAADVLSDDDHVAIVRALDLVFCSHTVHGKSLQSSSQVARSTEAGRAAAAVRGESSAAHGRRRSRCDWREGVHGVHLHVLRRSLARSIRSTPTPRRAPSS
jgi:hypothetical protein